jgi:hypothetical protein
MILIIKGQTAVFMRKQSQLWPLYLCHGWQGKNISVRNKKTNHRGALDAEKNPEYQRREIDN